MDHNTNDDEMNHLDMSYKEKEDIKFIEKGPNDFESDMLGVGHREIDEVTSEPEIYHWCRDDEEAKSLLIECVKLLRKDAIDDVLSICEQISINLIINKIDCNYNSQAENKLEFVKNFYMVTYFYKN